MLRYVAIAALPSHDSLLTSQVPVPPLSITGTAPVIQLIDSSGNDGKRRAVLRVGSQTVTGTNLSSAAAPSAFSFTTTKGSIISNPLPTVQFGNLTLAVQSAGYRPSATTVPGQTGADSVTFTVPATAMADTMTRNLVVATASGSSTASVTFVPPPTVTQIRTFTGTTDVEVPIPLSGGTLVRGKQYRLVGKGLVVGSNLFDADVVRVLFNGIVVGRSLASNLEVLITVPPNATSGMLTLTGAGGTASIGPFTAADPPSSVTIVGVSLSPTTIPGGKTTTATIAINGTIPAGGSAGNLAITLASPDQAVGVPTTLVPITANPMIVQIPTRGVATQHTDTIRVSNDPNATTLGLISAALTLQPPAPTSVAVTPNPIVGGTSGRGVVHLNTNVNGVKDLPVTLVNSDPTTATVPATALIFGDSAAFTFTTQVPPTDRPITITATSGGVSQSVTFTVKAATLASASAQPASILAGSGQATVTAGLSGTLAAPATLSISCDAGLSCPSSVPINVGQSSVSFPVTAQSVLNAAIDSVRMTLNGTTKSAGVTVTPIAIQTMTLSPSSVKAGVNSSLTVQLNTPVPTGLTASVSFSSSDPSVHVPSTPTTFAAADQTKLVTLTTSGTLTANKTVTITATFTEVTPSGTVTSSKTVALTLTP
jgi:hypothetical protein